MLKRLEIVGFKSFAKKTVLDFSSSVTSIVGPNGSGKSNVAEAFRFALGEQSMKSMRGKRSEDLIFSGSHSAPRTNRASVAVVFDNPARGGVRPFKLDFDEVIVERAVFRDGASEYALNGSKVRLRDVQELLAGANIGETGHHIISQGEADRILLASPRERRELLEDALGLKVYEFKKQEAERKLEKTEENVHEVQLLQREIAPHLRFLEKQVEKLDKAEELRQTLAKAAREYFAIEDVYLRTEREKANAMRKNSVERLASADAEFAKYDERSGTDPESIMRAQAVRSAESTLDRIRNEQSDLARQIGRAEGALEEAKKRASTVTREEYVQISQEDFTTFKNEVEHHTTFETLKAFVVSFFARHTSIVRDTGSAEEVERLSGEYAALTTKSSELAGNEERARSALARARETITAYEETGKEIKQRILQLAGEKANAESDIARQDGRLRELGLLEEELNRDRAEVLALAGSEAASYTALDIHPVEDRKLQEDRKRGLLRLKIRLEEAGGTGEDVRAEFKEASEREQFLTRELEDLTKSAESLRTLLADLEAELAKQFTEGLIKVNESFGEFFAVLFGGGGAKLTLEEFSPREKNEDEEGDDIEPTKPEQPGIDVTIHLPKKKVQSLVQLSGGERALTSIALIFAMSQVNPPPFLILDETDAALDEANSRRYGDMIEALAKKSQLVVITHNRETMNRAGILYGVTMGSDGISKILSVKFEEALAVAK